MRHLSEAEENLLILARMEKDFMEPQIEGPCNWFTVHDGKGEFVGSVSIYDVEDEEDAIEFLGAQDDDAQVECYFGYGARLSAPGYMDCTEWSITDTYEDAVALLVGESPYKVAYKVRCPGMVPLEVDTLTEARAFLHDWEKDNKELGGIVHRRESEEDREIVEIGEPEDAWMIPDWVGVGVIERVVTEW